MNDLGIAIFGAGRAGHGRARAIGQTSGAHLVGARSEVIEMVSRACVQQSPLGALVRGVLAGAAGTIAMDCLWFYRYKRGGGELGFLEWELSAGLDDWSKAPAPAQVGKRLFEGFFQRELPPRWAALTTNVMHWAYGLGWGATYGLVAGTVCPPRIRSGLLFGTVVWTVDYIVLPLAKLYKPMWEYDLPTLANDLSAHLVYGAGTALVYGAGTAVAFEAES